MARFFLNLRGVAIVAGATFLASYASAGVVTHPLPIGTREFGGVQMSGNGRFLLFSADIVPGIRPDYDSVRDLFVTDRWTGQTKLITRGFDGTPANGTTQSLDIDYSGRWIVFTNTSTNLTPSDETEADNEPYLYDNQSGQLTSLAGNTTLGAYGITISGNGQMVYLASLDTYQPLPAISVAQVYRYDRLTRLWTIESRASNGDLADNNCFRVYTKYAGDKVVFDTTATNLIADDDNGAQDIIIRDIELGTNSLVNKAMDGTVANGTSLILGTRVTDASGRYVVFGSTSDELVPGTTASLRTYLYDGATETVSLVGAADLFTFALGISGDAKTILYNSAQRPDGSAMTSSQTFRVDRATGEQQLLTTDLDGNEPRNTSGQTIDHSGQAVVVFSDDLNLVPDFDPGVPWNGSTFVVNSIRRSARELNGMVIWRASGGALGRWQMVGGSISSWKSWGNTLPGWVPQISGDVRGDGRTSVFLRDGTSNTIQVSEFSEVGLTRRANVGAIAQDWFIKGLGDFDNDGYQDLVVQSNTTGDVRAYQYRNRLTGAWWALGNYSGHQVVGAQDYDHDGQVDLLAMDSSRRLNVWTYDRLVNDDVIYVGPVSPSWSPTVVTGDFNNDHRPDIQLVNNTSRMFGFWAVQNGQIQSWQRSGLLGSAWLPVGPSPAFPAYDPF